jgi:hypothetical protein
VKEMGKEKKPENETDWIESGEKKIMFGWISHYTLMERK